MCVRLWKLWNQPCSSGSDRPGTLPARRPCFTTANPSLGKPKTAEEIKETPETIADLLFKNPENFSVSSSTNSTQPFCLVSTAAFATDKPLSSEEWERKRWEGMICWWFLQEKLQLVNMDVPIFSVRRKKCWKRTEIGSCDQKFRQENWVICSFVQ